MVPAPSAWLRITLIRTAAITITVAPSANPAIAVPSLWSHAAVVTTTSASQVSYAHTPIPIPMAGPMPMAGPSTLKARILPGSPTSSSRVELKGPELQIHNPSRSPD
ncbi:hypothetical protein Vretimale_4115 [Volvox reticuliferus]|uniref:Secreted protein n=1 Tax=Volvox reticuliferus TaxID=1737510 RepID=A0A8J4FE09_9CHLO|nr:hypothetical protein Vretifemale_1680 [Volvox reticuliferus]GIL98748.1 hypothetical protein Vretimale_4115 [Volvox reticuliferus]